MSTSSQFRGVYAIPVTPFNEDLSVDWESLRKCIAFSLEAGAHGIVLPVNASEGPFLTDAERKEVIRRLKRDAKNSRAAEARRKRDGVYKKKKINKSQR